MIIDSVYPSGFSIFSDDIRHEINGKMTLVGTYVGEMNIIGELPARLPMLACLIAFRFIPPDEPITVDCKIILETDAHEEQQLFGAYLELGPTPNDHPQENPFDRDGTFAEARIAAQMPGLEIKAPGRLKVRAYMPNGDEVRLGSLRIKISAPQKDEDAPV